VKYGIKNFGENGCAYHLKLVYSKIAI